MIEHSSESQLSSRCDLYLDGGIVVTLDEGRTVIDDGAVAISGQRILAVGSSAELGSQRVVVRKALQISHREGRTLE